MNVLGRERDGQDQSFDASKYGFFGEAQEGEDAGLEGSLEAGIDAPPEEDPGLVTEELDEAELWLSNEQDDAAPDEDISYASLFAGSQHSQPGSQSLGGINGSSFSPWAPQAPSASASASWGFPGSAFSQQPLPPAHSQQQEEQQQQQQHTGMAPSSGYSAFSAKPYGASMNGGVNGTSNPPGMPAALNSMASVDTTRSGVPTQPLSTQTPATMQAPTVEGSSEAAAITPELLASLQELLQKAQQPGADVVQSTQAVVRQLQQQLPPELVMSVLQQASGLQFDHSQPTKAPPQSSLAQQAGMHIAGSAPMTSFRAPSPGSFSQSTSPHALPAALARSTPPWNGLPLGPQPMGVQHASPVGNGMGQTSGLPRSPQLSPADMMMRLQLENQQRSLLGAGMSRPLGSGAIPNHMQMQPGFPGAGIPGRPAGLMPAINPAQGSADHLPGYLSSAQARAMRPDSLQMLQFQRNLLAQQQQQQQQAPRSQGMVSLADIEAQLLLQARGGPSPTFNQEPMRPGFPHLPRPGMSLPMPRPGLGTPVGSPAANGLLNAAAMRGAGLPGMGMPRPMQPRPGIMAGSPQLGGGMLTPQTLAASRIALERQQQAQQLQQTQQALAMMQSAGQLPHTLPRPQGFPGGPGGFQGPRGPGFPGQVPRFAPPRPQMGPMGMMGPRPDIFPPGLGYQQGPRNRLQSSKLMERAEIDQILRIQWKSLHGGPPYIEDYYYLAYVQKHGRNRNPRDFAPAALREMAPTERLGGEPLAYVKLEGLGKIPFSNIRRPKPLMDVAMTDESSASDEEETETIGTVVQGAEEGASEEVVEVKKAPKKKAVARPLEQEPQLAARIMIEDCMCLLLDVDDIDRLHAAYQGVRDNEGPLRQRRALLMEGFASSLRLSDSALCSHQTPGPSPRAAAASQPLTDGVFLRLMALPKGRVLLARALRLLYAPLSAGWVPAPELNGPRPTPTPTKGCSPAMRLAWALLRNVSYIFGGHTAAPLGLASLQAAQPDAQEVEERSKVAAAGVEVMQRLDSPRAVCDCIAALVSGDLINPSSSAAGQAPGSANHLLPLLPPTSANREMPWLGSIIAELLTRAQELGLASQPVAQLMGGMRGGLAVNEGHFWRDSVATLLSALQAHLNALLHLNQAAKEAGDAAAQEMTRKLVPIKLIRASLPQSSETQREELRSILFLLT
ncbi:hypothetical protein WJX74_003138 [Apatococcus lobatus]|uniref:Uncharacterized protein n=1 Tax=Apatococcus lobatus TaxID=904363 RepID=A0AAW1SFR6_9CHLO